MDGLFHFILINKHIVENTNFLLLESLAVVSESWWRCNSSNYVSTTTRRREKTNSRRLFDTEMFAG